jgi:membrane fusion protein (multidrug efflux system)
VHGCVRLRIVPTRIAEVRARVSGIIDRRNSEQGSDVKKGEVYEIDAKPFQIELDAAEAALSKANAVPDQESQNE